MTDHKAIAEFWDCSREEYDAAADWLRSSELKDFRISPKVYHWRYVLKKMPKKQQTSAMLFGTLFHALVLEGEKQWNVADQCEAAYGSGDRKGQQCSNIGVGTAGGKWLCGQHSKKVVLQSPENLIAPEDEDDLWNMKEELEKHPACSLLTECHNEHAVRWEDRNYGIKCKALLDSLVFNGDIADLKATDEFNADAIWRKLENHGWAFSSAFYERGVNNVLPATRRDWKYVVVERSRPYRIAVISMKDHAFDFMDPIRQEVDDELRSLAKCREFGEYPDKEINMHAPQWFGFRHAGVTPQ